MSASFYIAENAANIECQFSDICNTFDPNNRYGTQPYFINGKKFEIIDVYNYERAQDESYAGKEYPKAVVLLNEETNELYIHFNGTGDGNWGYNAAAYGGEPSRMQQKVLKWFDDVMNMYSGKYGEVYVTGHSQGGNNAMYVTMRSEYRDKISMCIPLDGPGFSDKFVNDTISEYYGNDTDAYNAQRDKIFAYNGENDYVSILGETSIVPEGHERFIKYTGGDPDFELFHHSKGLVDENGKISLVDDDSGFRKYIKNAISKLNDIEPAERRRKAADVMMKLCENYITGKGEYMKDELSEEEFKEFKGVLAELIVAICADNPEELIPILESFGLDKAAAEGIIELIKHINTYPPEVRVTMLCSVLEIIVLKEDDESKKTQIDVDWSKLPVIIAVNLPELVETIASNPEDIDKILRGVGAYDAIQKLIKDHPWETVGTLAAVIIFSPLLSPYITPFVNAAFAVSVMADIAIRFVQGAVWLGEKAIEGIVKLFEAAKNAAAAIYQWYRNTFNAGVKYVRSNPYFKVDTSKLRDYAQRIEGVNRRLSILDGELRGLYGKVKLKDLWDIICANLVTSESPTLNKVKYYLSNSAYRFDTAENNAERYMGG